MPKISVIIPTFNGEKRISRAIESVLVQTIQDFEIIVVDDASTDKTREIVKEYQKKDNIIKLITLNKNSGGPNIPRRIGIQNSKGKYVTLLDQDDMYLPNNLEIKSKILDTYPEIDIIDGFAWMVDEKTRQIIDCAPYTFSNFMIRKRVFEEIGNFSEKQVNDDSLWFAKYRKWKNHKGIFILKEPLVLYFRHPDQSIYKPGKTPLVYAKNLENYLKDPDASLYFSKKDYSFFYSRIGNYYCLEGNLKGGREYFKKSLNSSFNFFSLFFYLLSFSRQKSYKKIEEFLRCLQKNLLWKARKILAQVKYKESYNKAIEILNNL